MKALTTVALMVVAFVLLSAPEALAGQPPPPTTQYVDIDVVVVIYKKFYYNETSRVDLSAADVQDLKDSTEEARAFIWQASNLKCNINVLEYLEIDRALYVDQIYRAGNGKYMLYHWSIDGEHSVETDLIDAGYVDGDTTLVISLWSWDSGAGGVRYAGECYPGTKTNPTHPHLLGDSAHVTIPVTVTASGFSKGGVILHETMHALDSKLGFSGYPDAMTSPDNPSSAGFLVDGGAMWNYLDLDGVLWSEWDGMYDWLATTQTVTDTDEDGVPDDADVPLDEVSFGSDKRKADKDNDGFTDLEEAVDAGFWGSSLPRTADTDGDGTADGSDAEPLIDCTSNIAKNTGVTVDGSIGGGEYTLITSFDGGGSDCSVDVYAAWTDGALYFAADVTDDNMWKQQFWGDFFKVCIDADNDGWWLSGDENYRIMLAPTWTSGESWFRIDNMNAGGSWTSGLATTDTNAAVVHSGTDWVAEIEIAASDLLGVTFSASTQLRIAFQINDRDTIGSGVDRDIYDIFTGATVHNSSWVVNGLESVLYCVDFTLVN